MIVASLIVANELLLTLPAPIAVKANSPLYARHQRMVEGSGLLFFGERFAGWRSNSPNATWRCWPSSSSRSPTDLAGYCTYWVQSRHHSLLALKSFTRPHLGARVDR